MDLAPRGLARACRICLSEDYLQKSIFDNFAIGAMQISEVIRRCASIQICKNDGLPEQICLTCVRELHRSLSFRVLCEGTDARLRKDLDENIEGSKHDIIKVFSNSKQQGDPLLDNVPKVVDIKKEVDNPVASISSDDVSKISAQEIPTCPEIQGVKQERVEPEEYIDCNLFLQDVDIQEPPLIKTEIIDYGDSVSGQSYFVSVSNNYGNELCSSENESQTTRGSQEGEGEDTSEDRRPFKCEVCNRTFSYRSNLINHARIHSGVLPYPCDRCEEEFAWKTQLVHHKKYKCKMTYPAKAIVCRQEPESTVNAELIEQPTVEFQKLHRSLEVKIKKRERQERYRKQNREKLKQREAERRKRIQYLQSIAGSTSANINSIELNSTETIASTFSSLGGTQEEREKSALQKKRERQQRYREQNREKLKRREAERRQRLQNAEMMTELSTSSNNEWTDIMNGIGTNSRSVDGLEGMQHLFVEVSQQNQGQSGASRTEISDDDSKFSCRKFAPKYFDNNFENNGHSQFAIDYDFKKT